MATHIDSKLKETIHARTDAAAQAAHHLVDRVAKRAEISEEKLRASADLAQQKLQKTLQTARVRSFGARDSVAAFMRRHPLASIGMALGIGALLAARGSSRAAQRRAIEPADSDDNSVH
jgi:ElaB/YqjD/DUF883 family membrane-anchored ribosome-binding protein